MESDNRSAGHPFDPEAAARAIEVVVIALLPGAQ